MQKHLSNARAGASSGARGLNVDPSLHIHPYFVSAFREAEALVRLRFSADSPEHLLLHNEIVPNSNNHEQSMLTIDSYEDLFP